MRDQALFHLGLRLISELSQFAKSRSLSNSIVIEQLHQAADTFEVTFETTHYSISMEIEGTKLSVSVPISSFQFYVGKTDDLRWINQQSFLSIFAKLIKPHIFFKDLYSTVIIFQQITNSDKLEALNNLKKGNSNVFNYMFILLTNVMIACLFTYFSSSSNTTFNSIFLILNFLFSTCLIQIFSSSLFDLNKKIIPNFWFLFCGLLYILLLFYSNTGLDKTLIESTLFLSAVSVSFYLIDYEKVFVNKKMLNFTFGYITLVLIQFVSIQFSVNILISVFLLSFFLLRIFFEAILSEEKQILKSLRLDLLNVITSLSFIFMSAESTQSIMAPSNNFLLFYILVLGVFMLLGGAFLWVRSSMRSLCPLYLICVLLLILIFISLKIIPLNQSLINFVSIGCFVILGAIIQSFSKGSKDAANH